MTRALCIAVFVGAFVAGCGSSGPGVDAGPADARVFGACTGPGTAPPNGAELDTEDGFSVIYTDFLWGANNDCPAPDAPAGVISVTIEGTQMNGPVGDGLSVCLPRPDLITDAPIQLSDPTLVQIVGASANVNQCDYTLMSADANPTGIMYLSGFCTGKGSAYAVSLQGTLELHESCSNAPGTDVVATVALSGTVSVAAR